MNHVIESKGKLHGAKALETDADEIRPQYVLDAPSANALFASDIVRANGASIAETINQLENAPITDLNSEWALALPSYSDQVLPFNVTLAGANEYGAMCAAKILGIEILNEGSGISVDDAVAESQATFVARAIEPLQAVVSPLDLGPSLSPDHTRLARAAEPPDGISQSRAISVARAAQPPGMASLGSRTTSSARAHLHRGGSLAPDRHRASFFGLQSGVFNLRSEV